MRHARHLLSPGGLRRRVVLSLAAVAAMLMAFAAPAGARTVRAHPQPGHRPVIRVVASFRPLRAHRGRRAPAPRAGVAAQARFNDNISEDDCLTAYGQGQAGDQGWAESRFASCTAGIDVLTKRIYPDGYPGPYRDVGDISFLLTDINQPSNSGAYVTHTRIMDNVSYSGDISEVYLDVTTNCNISQDTSGNCNPFSSYTYTYSAEGLVQDGSEVLVTTFYVDPGSNADQSSFNWTQTQITARLDPPGVTPPTTVYSTPTGFRCDYASYLPPGGGCVIDWAPTPVLYYDSRSNPLVAPVAQHIYDAQHYLLFTPWGEPGYPLTRDANPSDRDKSNQIACGDFVPSDSVNTSCDEYPLASTYQGALFQPDYSTRGVPTNANSSQGGLTIQFYLSQRILNGDPFYVDPILSDGTYSWH